MNNAMKRYSITYILVFFVMLTTVSCADMFERAMDTEKVEAITVNFKVNAVTGFVPKTGDVPVDPSFPTEGLRAVATNVNEAYRVETTVNTDGFACFENMTPGLYSISISGVADKSGEEFYLNGNLVAVSIMENISEAEAETNSNYSVNIRPARVGPLCFSEIYYCGVGDYYFRDQFYRIYNNGDETYYLDGLCFAQLHPNIATATLPIWPDEDGLDNYVYGIVVWRIPGDGTQYPLKPGESIVIAQEAADHTDSNHSNGQSVMDSREAEWETWSGNATRDNPAVDNLPYVFWPSPNTFQWLTSVFGGAFCIFKADVDTDNAYWNTAGNWQTEVDKTTKYAKIKAEWVMDGVELLTSSTSMNMKRIPGFVDAGGISVNETYVGKSVSRVVIDTRADGTPIYMDTNNSTDDLQVNDSPVLRRNGEKKPAWN